MNQQQINQQYLRIARAVNKAYKAIEDGLITEKVFYSKLACADAAYRTMEAAQHKLKSTISTEITYEK